MNVWCWKYSNICSKLLQIKKIRSTKAVSHLSSWLHLQTQQALLSLEYLCGIQNLYWICWQGPQVIILVKRIPAICGTEGIIMLSNQSFIEGLCFSEAWIRSLWNHTHTCPVWACCSCWGCCWGSCGCGAPSWNGGTCVKKAKRRTCIQFSIKCLEQCQCLVFYSQTIYHNKVKLSHHGWLLSSCLWYVLEGKDLYI